MRDKLIEILSVPIHPRIGADPAEAVADYLLDNGIIVSPCKVGDTVYFLSERTEKQGRKKVHSEFVDKGEVDRIIIGQKGVPQMDVCNSENEWWLFDAEDDFGKTVFLTLEEATEALAKERRATNE